MALGNGIWLWVAVVPEVGVTQRIDRAFVASTSRWVEDQGITNPIGQHEFSNLRSMAAPGRVVVGWQIDAIDPAMPPSNVHLELHSDGSSFVAIDIAMATSGPVSGGVPARGLGTRTLAISAPPLVEIAGRWAIHQGAVPGSSRLQAGLYDADGPGGAFTQGVELQTTANAGSTLRRVPNTRVLSGVAPQAESVLDLTGDFSTQAALSASSQVIDGLLHWFGAAECEFITLDGDIVLDAWGGLRQEVHSWASARRIPIV